jgi:hypothetical protein
MQTSCPIFEAEIPLKSVRAYVDTEETSCSIIALAGQPGIAVPTRLPPTRAQARQQVNRISVFYQIEALIELHKPEPNSARLGRLDKSAGLLNRVLDYLEETA